MVELDKPWEESSFMFQGLELKSPSDVLAVQKECSFVWVDYDEFAAALLGHAQINKGIATMEVQGEQFQVEAGNLIYFHLAGSLVSK